MKLMGDGILAEFASVIEAVQCAAKSNARWRLETPGFPTSAELDFASVCIWGM